MQAFQSTHPRGVRRASRRMPDRSMTFQSTHPRGVRPPPKPHLACRAMFQSTHPRGVRPAEHGEQDQEKQVSNHAPAWGATSDCESAHSGRRCFNPRTRVGCDVDLTSQTLTTGVSIHAPAWGATGRAIDAKSTAAVSIHAPAWGATAAFRRRKSGKRRFNPRTRVGCDGENFRAGTLPAGVNPRTRVGCDDDDALAGVTAAGFNPRTRVGCDFRCSR